MKRSRNVCARAGFGSVTASALALIALTLTPVALAQVTPLTSGGTCPAGTEFLDNPLRIGPSWCVACRSGSGKAG